MTGIADGRNPRDARVSGEPPAPHWPAGTVAALLAGDAVTAPTRAALRARLAPAPPGPRHLGPAAFAVLAAACARLVPQDGRAVPVDVAGAFDRRLGTGAGDGWRYDALPPDAQAHARGLRGLDETARALRGAGFLETDDAGRDAVLAAVQAGDPPGAAWEGLPAALWFEELLAALVEIDYAHPSAQDEIGYAGFADRPGWTAIGLGEREDREPRPLGDGA